VSSGRAIVFLNYDSHKRLYVSGTYPINEGQVWWAQDQSVKLLTLQPLSKVVRDIRLLADSTR